MSNSDGYPDMYSQPTTLQLLQRSHSNKSHSTYESAATTASSASSRLLFGEIALTPATSIDHHSTCAHNSISSLICSTSSASSRLWLSDACCYSILDRLGPKDLCKVRLACHYFASKAASRLFESTAVTFKTSAFSKPARIEALSRIGRHIKTFTSRMPPGSATHLPPVIDAFTGAEKQFVYEPDALISQCGPARDQAPRYGSWDMQALLTRQYPPLFHAATNVSAFFAAFYQLDSLVHLKVLCPESSGTAKHPCSIVDYALISLRIAIERAPLHHLSALSLSAIHFGGLRWLHPVHGLGSTASSAKRWSQIRRLSICIESIPLSSSSSRVHAHPLGSLHLLHTYLSAFQPRLTHLYLRWKGVCCPLRYISTVNVPVHGECTHASTDGQLRELRPLQSPRLCVLELENTVVNLAGTRDLVFKEKHALPELRLKDIGPRKSGWHNAPALSTTVSDGDECIAEFMDVPVMLSPTAAEACIAGPLLKGMEYAVEQVNGQRSKHVLSRWLSKRRQNPRKELVNLHSFWISRTGVGAVRKQPQCQKARFSCS